MHVPTTSKSDNPYSEKIWVTAVAAKETVVNTARIGIRIVLGAVLGVPAGVVVKNAVGAISGYYRGAHETVLWRANNLYYDFIANGHEVIKQGSPPGSVLTMSRGPSGSHYYYERPPILHLDGSLSLPPGRTTALYQLEVIPSGRAVGIFAALGASYFVVCAIPKDEIDTTMRGIHAFLCMPHHAVSTWLNDTPSSAFAQAEPAPTSPLAARAYDALM